MTSDRPYRKAMAHADAIAELTGNAGTQFDPEVVQALVGYLFGRRQAGLAAVSARLSRPCRRRPAERPRRPRASPKPRRPLAGYLRAL